MTCPSLVTLSQKTKTAMSGPVNRDYSLHNTILRCGFFFFFGVFFHVIGDIIRQSDDTSLVLSSYFPRSRELWTQKLKSHLVRAQSLNVLPLKPGVGQYIAIHATLTAREFFLAYFNPSGPFTCIFSKTSPDSCCVGCG